MKIPIKNKYELRKMREAGQVAARIKEESASFIKPGVTTLDIDQYAKSLMEKYGAKSAFLGYHGYPGYTCISINEEVVHGIPGSRVVQPGDIVSIDVGIIYDGFIGDNATTVAVSVIDPEINRLLEVSWKALDAAIQQAVPGNKLSDISHAVQQVAEAGGYSIVRDFVGHGVGRKLHEPPQIPNYGPPGKGPRLKEGMVFALEPMINLGDAKVEVMPDGWTVKTQDRKPSVHVEHTVAVCEGGGEILTQV